MSRELSNDGFNKVVYIELSREYYVYLQFPRIDPNDGFTLIWEESNDGFNKIVYLELSRRESKDGFNKILYFELSRE